MTTPVRLLAPVVITLLVAAGWSAGCAGAPPPSGPPSASASAAGPEPTAVPGGPQVLRITHRSGRVSGDTGTVAVPAGRSVRIEVTSDSADEVHLHGYDREAQVPAGGTATLEFTADIPGEFELELHASGDRLATLQVR